MQLTLRATWLLLFALLAPGLSIKAVAAPADAQATAAELQVTLDRLNALTEWLSDADKKRAQWMTSLQRQDKEIARVNQDVRALSKALDAIEKKLSELTERQTALKTEQLRQAKLIAEHVAAAYRLTGQDFLKQLLNQESPDEFQRMIRYHRIFSESRLAVLADYRATLVELTATNADLKAQREVQQNQQQALVDEQNNLSAERNQRAKLIAELDAEAETKSEEVARLEQDRTRLEELLAELRRRSVELDGTAFVRAKGTLPMPTTGKIRHAFGARRADGRLRWHGVDIAAPHGTPIAAVYRGRVIFSDWLRGFGLLTILDHGSGYMTLYGHADVLHKQVGDWVESGEVIAGAGNSGGKKGSGVYFEVRHKGEPQDPINWVAR
jgi:septal ring factor EnvC (AmiA/AmiB activator)